MTEQQLFLVSVGDWFQDLWPIDVKIHKCLWYPFLYIVSFKYDNPRSVIFLLLQKRKLWLREVEQFAQSHTASKVGVEIKKPSLLDTGMLPSLPHHTSTSSLRWMKLTLGRVGDMFVEWGPSWRHSWRCMLLFNPNTHSWDPLCPSKLILPKYHSKPCKSLPGFHRSVQSSRGWHLPRLLWSRSRLRLNWLREPLVSSGHSEVSTSNSTMWHSHKALLFVVDFTEVFF